jgi:hypothetical protein
MKLPDVNVLIYILNRNAPRHEASHQWFEELLATGHPFAVSTLTLSAVVRISTNPRVMNVPATVAFDFCRDLLGRPQCVVVEPGAQHWTIFEGLCQRTNANGPRVTDAWYAALAIEHGCEWVTFDRDFARFPGLRWSTPV